MTSPTASRLSSSRKLPSPQKPTLLGKAAHYWGGWSKSIRCLVVATGCGVLLAPLAWHSYSLQHAPSDLFPYPLKPVQAEEVSQMLSTWGINHQVTAGETNIGVAPEVRASLLMRLGVKGLPHQDLTPDPADMLHSQQEVRNRLNQNLARRLEESIRSMPNVRGAQVTIAVPSTDSYNPAPTTASVFLTMQGQQSLTPEQVSGVAHLVAASVPNLEDEKVSIVDSTGTVARKTTTGTQALGNFQLQLQKEFDTYLADKAQAALDHAYGVGRGKVDVNTQFDFSEMEVRRTSVGKPGDGEAVVVEQKVKEGFDKKPVAVDSLEEGESATSTTPGAKYEKVCEARRFKNDEAFTFTVFRTPRVERITAAVSLNIKGQEANAKILVMGALGINESRGDYLGIATVPGGPPVIDKAAPIPSVELTKMPEAVSPAWAGLLLLPGFALLGLWTLGRSVHHKRSQPLHEMSPAKGQHELVDLIHVSSGASTKVADTKVSMLQTQLEDLARDKPIQIAAKLRTLIKTNSATDH